MSKLLNVLSSAALLMPILAGSVYGASEAHEPGISLHYDPHSSTEKRLDRVVKLVNAAVSFYEKNGLKASLSVFQNQKGAYCTRYEHQYSGLVIWDTRGTVLSYCKYPGLIGKNVLSWRAPDGALPMVDILKKVSEKPDGTLFSFTSNLNPHTNKPSSVTFFLRRSGNLVFGAPAYHVEPMHKDLSPQEDVVTFTKRPCEKHEKPLS